MSLSLKQKQKQKQKQKLAPRQVLNARLLQLSNINLEQEIILELEKNPLLEQVESEIHDLEKSEETPIDDLDVSIEDMYSGESAYFISEQKKDIPIVSKATFIEKLIKQLNELGLNEDEIEIAEEIVWNINEQGYLETELVLIADRFEILEEEIEPILHKVQRIEPKGIASRNLQECLLIQMEDSQGSLHYKIIEKSFGDFMHKRYEKICKKFGCTKIELQNSIDFITQLNPRPGEGYNDKFQTVIPDIIIAEDGEDWIINTNDNSFPELRISQAYNHQLQNKNLDSKTRNFLRSKMDSAQWFMEAINQRRNTLINVMGTIISFQPEWFAGDMDFLRPLKLKDIAEKLEIDVSTVSRSTRGKYVDTPYGVFELKYFLSESITLEGGKNVATFNVKRCLEKIIWGEDKDNPFNDDTLVSKLADQNYKLARRTVAKYRDQLGYPVARLRKKI